MTTNPAKSRTLEIVPLGVTTQTTPPTPKPEFESHRPLQSQTLESFRFQGFFVGLLFLGFHFLGGFGGIWGLFLVSMVVTLC